MAGVGIGELETLVDGLTGDRAACVTTRPRRTSPPLEAGEDGDLSAIKPIGESGFTQQLTGSVRVMGWRL